MTKYIDVSPRGSGKTKRMVEWLKADLENRAIIVGTSYLAMNLVRMYELPDKCVFTVEDIKFGRLRGIRKREMCIDEIDIFLQQLDLRIIGFSTSMGSS